MLHFFVGRTANLFATIAATLERIISQVERFTKQGTIFEESGVSLDKWLIAIWMIANCKNGISSYELGKNIGVEQRSAWFMLQRIRIAMEQGSFGKLSGTVEADETFIGGDAKWKHRSRRDADQKRGGRLGLKVSVLGMLERKGKVRAKVVASRTTHDLIPPIHEHVEFGSELFTDEHLPYMTHLPKYYIHDAVNHAREYVRGNVHTNSIENFWSLLKRSIKGTYISIQAEHLQKYIEEQCFRYNTREMTDRERFVELVKSVSGKRLTWDTLTGY